MKRRIWIQFGMTRLILVGLGLAGLALAVTGAASYIAANRLVASELARELVDISGRRLVFDGAPVIRIFPDFAAEFKNVSLHDWTASTDAFPVVKMPVVRLSLSVMAALKGEARMTGATLEQPVFQIKAQNGAWQLPFGPQAKLAGMISQLANAVQGAPDTQLRAEIQSHAPGLVTIKDGTIILGPSPLDVISKIDGTLMWGRQSRGGRLKAEGVWRGEPTKIEINADNMVNLAIGTDTGLSASLESKPLTSRFSGKTRLLPAPYFEGEIFAQTNSLLTAIVWQGLKPPFDFAAFDLTVSGAIKGDADKWQLDESRLQLGSNSGTGGLIFQPKMVPPTLSGTLDFASLDLAMLTRIFEFGPRAAQATKPTFSTDLRISADTASLGTVSLNKVAASLQVSPHANALDIHNAAAFGGTVQMSLKNQNDTETELRILAENIETKALGGLGEPFAGLPKARGSISAILHGANIADADYFETAQGTVKFRLGAGALAGLNANQMIRALRNNETFELKGEALSVLSFTEINCEARLAQGALQFESFNMGLEKAALMLTGTYGLKDQHIAMTGTLDLEAGHPETANGAEHIRVRFNGNRNTPLISGIHQNPLQK
jgi:AsmA protein